MVKKQRALVAKLLDYTQHCYFLNCSSSTREMEVIKETNLGLVINKQQKHVEEPATIGGLNEEKREISLLKATHYAAPSWPSLLPRVLRSYTCLSQPCQKDKGRSISFVQRC